jgi:hypothetical protein
MKELLDYCAVAAGTGGRPTYSRELRRSVCVGGADPGPKPFTINFAMACMSAYKTDKVRYVDSETVIYVACMD